MFLYFVVLVYIQVTFLFIESYVRFTMVSFKTLSD